MTGAANGIGRQFARDLLATGRYRLVLCDIDWPALHAAFGAQPVDLHALDVRSWEAWQVLFDGVLARYGRVDVLCNIAGVIIPGWYEQLDRAAIAQTIDVNVMGVLQGSHFAATYMVRQGHGHIINIASMAAIGFTPGNALYAASKHAVRGFSVSLAVELRNKGVYVTTVCPGVVATQMLDVQVGREEAAITFANGRPLSVGDVSRTLQRVLARRPVEAYVGSVFFPKVVNLLPALGLRLRRLFVWRGLRAARQLRARR